MGKFIDGMLQMHKNFCNTLLGEEKMKVMKISPLLSEFAKNASTKDTIYTINYKKGKTEDEETEKLLAKKADLENELKLINDRLVNKKSEVDLLTKFEEGKWYEYSDCPGNLSLLIFKHTKSDFIRDGQLWVHNGFSKTITGMQSLFTHQDVYWLSTEGLTDNVKEVEEVYAHKMIEDEIAQLKGLE